MAYKDLIIQLFQDAPHHFVASALVNGKPAASNTFELRLDELRILERLRDLEKEAVNPDSKETFNIDFGQELYSKVLAGELGDYFQRQLEANSEGLRISLQFDDNASDLATLPWEFLHDGGDFLVARRKTLISRLPAKLNKVQSPPLESILRMLVIISSPADPICGPLDSEKERDRILQAVDKLYVQHKVDVDFTDDATFETIQNYLNDKDYHIVHFTGHGREIDGQGYLVLESEDGKGQLVDNQTISDLFANRGIRLVVLSACESADLANKLVRKGVPAAVAMQYSILDPSATGFAFAFYRALASGRAVDLSLTEARLAMRNARGSNKVDFATPVLYLLDPECLHIDQIKPEVTEIFQKPVMLGEVQVMRDGFVGRQKELRRLQKAFSSGVKRAAIVHGWGGIGKTVLATRLALRMTRQFEGFFGHKCNPQTRPEDILNGLNAFLIMAGIQALNQILYSPSPLQVKTAALVSILNQKRFLIILDNFESCLDESRTRIANPELRRFVEHLLNATVSNTKYIITTRYDFDPLEGRLIAAIEHLSVPEMPLYQAVWLMNNHSELAGLDLEKKKKIYKNIGGHPWTVGMFARHVSASDVDNLLLELEPLKRELKDFTLFDKSYSELDKSSKEVLIRASIFEEAFPVEALRWMVGDAKNPSPPVDKQLDVLVSWGLMSRQAEGDQSLYSVHTLVRQFTGQEAEKIGVDRRSLLMRAAQHYERRVKESNDLWDLLRARDYYYRAEEWNKAADIMTAAWKYLDRWGYVELAMNLLKQSADTTSGRTKAAATGNLAILYQSVGDWKTALKSFTEVKEIFEKEGDKRNVAASLHQLGMIHQNQGNYPEAVELYQQSLDLAKELGDKSSISKTLHQLGVIHQDQGNYPEAVRLFQQSLDLEKELGDKSGIAKTLHQLGMIHQNQGNYPEAVRLYQQSLDIKKELGDKSGISITLHQLGNVHYLQGNYPKAVELYQQSLDLMKELGNKSGLSKSLGQLGNVHFQQGNYPEAVRLYQQGLDIMKELGDKSGIAISLHQLGMIKEEYKDYEGALGYYVIALSILEELHDPNKEIAKESIARLRAIMGEGSFNKALNNRGGSE